MARPKTDPTERNEMESKRPFTAKRKGNCARCEKPYQKGDTLILHDMRRNAHATCLKKHERLLY